MVVASVFNIFGDLFFVGVLGMGAAGAAVATVLAQALSVVISLFIIMKTDLPFSFNLRMIRFNGRCNAQILKLGVPVAFQDLLVSISFFVLTAIVNSMGVIASAGKMDRSRKALLCGIGSSLMVSEFIAYLGFFHGNILCELFSKESDVVYAGWQYLKGYSIDVLFTSFLFCFIGFYNGAGRTKFVMLQGIFGAFCVRVPLSFIINHFFPDSIFYLSLATPSSTVVQIILCFICAKFFMKKDDGRSF